MNILVTGCAGFIGFHMSKILIENNYQVFGLDNINDYYDINLKKNRLKKLKIHKNFKFYKLDLRRFSNVKLLFKKIKIDIVINFAAQAGVRYSINNPRTYLENNIDAYFNLLELSRLFKVKHLIQASTSSVYGNNTKFPLKESEDTNQPLSFYSASKKATEVMSHSYSYMYRLPITCFRFFTVYGPFGRPDMALHSFAKNIIKNKAINLFNHGNHIRDFTYVEDVVFAIFKIIKLPSKEKIPFEVYNIGSNNPISLKKFVNLIEKKLNKKAKIKKIKMQKGDVYKTHADISKLIKKIKFKPQTDINQGIKKFLEWFRSYK